VALDIRFENMESQVSNESLAQVNELAIMLKNDPSVKVSIEGHMDKQGSATRNMELSAARARAVEDLLRNQGIDPVRLSSTGWGWTKPVADNKTESGRAQNRRIEIVKK
jgi:outer membrane protein OmpA-like peptidoglycan-associated protein